MDGREDMYNFLLLICYKGGALKVSYNNIHTVMMPCVVEMMDIECSERYSSSVTRLSSIRNWRWAKILLDGSRRLPPYRVHIVAGSWIQRIT